MSRRLYNAIFWGILLFLGSGTLWGASSRPSPLIEFNAYELIDLELSSEVFGSSFRSNDLAFASHKKDEKTPRSWPIPLIRSAAQSIFLSSGLSRFNGSSASVPPTLKAYQTP